VPFLNERGKPYQYISIGVDTTARKAAEDRLAQQAVLARVAEMAAVVAHEVRNSLAGVKGAMQVLLSRRSADDVEAAVIRGVIARVDSSSDLIDDLMVFARPRQSQLGIIQLRELVRETVVKVRRDFTGVPIEVSFRGSETSVAADAELVRAAIANLLINAIQAMESGGRIEVTVDRQDAMAFVAVRDTGPGIPPAIRSRVFEPFFTTKVRGGGLGLPIARRTADLHGGSLTLDFPPDGGTCVTLRLPVSSSPWPTAMAVPGDNARSDDH
jgi:signal transduction histidine kinase